MIRALCLTGPTASGKTALSLFLAERLGCEIISCDSMQIYREMDIGTAKATREEQARARHHMIDILSPSENYSAEDYRRDAMAVAADIAARGKLPLFVGGTGLYIDTVMRGGSAESPPSDAEVRAALMAEAEDVGGPDKLYERLRTVDPEAAEKTHKNNLRRVVRALEIYEVSGKTKTYFDKLSREASPDVALGMITLDFHNRDNLYRRVDKRVDEMIAMGLVNEVSSLYERGLLKPDTTAAQAIGYKEIVTYIKGERSLECAVEELKLSSRRYAKRQLTWFRHEADAVRLYVDFEDGRMKDIDTLTCEAQDAARALLAREVIL